MSRSIQVLTPAQQPLLLATVANGHSNGHVAIPEDETIESLVRPLVESSLLEASVEALAIAIEPRALASRTAPALNAPFVESTEVAPVATEQLAALASALEQVPAVETVAPTLEQEQVVAAASVEQVPAVEPVAPTVEQEQVVAAASVEQVPAVETVAPTVEQEQVVAAASVEQVPMVETVAPTVEQEQVVAAAEVEQVPTVEPVAPTVEQLAPVVAEQVAALAAEVEQVAPALVAAVAAIPDDPLVVEPTYDPGPLSTALALHAEALLHVINTQLDAFESAIRAIVATFQARPVSALLAAPCEIVNAPARPATRWLRTSRPSIRCAKPNDPNSSSLSSGPLTSALDGPCLPVDLRTLAEKSATKPGRPGKRATMPAWVMSLLVATALFLGAGRYVQYVSENQDAKAASIAGQHAAQASAGTLVSAPGDPHPLARFVEVTGLRVSADLNRKSQLQYLVVNHSSVRLADVVLKIAVRSAADSSGAPPLFTLSVAVPVLGPNQSKELRSDLDAALRSASIPDWENLRADVQVNSKQ